MTKKNTAYNKSIANSGAGRWSNRLHFAISFGSGWTFAIWLFVVNFNFSFSIELWLPGERFSNLPPSAILFRCALFMNNTEEKYWFEKFKESYKDFPVGHIIHCDKPDFIIKSDGKAIGVEVTQIFKDNTLDSSLNEKRKESLHGMLGNTLCAKLQSIIPCSFCLEIYWSKKDFSNGDIHRITEACVSHIKQVQYPTQNYLSFDIVNNGQLPEEIVDISFMNFHHLDKPFFVNTNSGNCW